MIYYPSIQDLKWVPLEYKALLLQLLLAVWSLNNWLKSSLNGRWLNKVDIFVPNNSPINFLLSFKGQYQFSIFINNVNMATIVITSYTLQSFCLVCQHTVQLDAFLSTTVQFQLRRF